jgi:hypothetical protein
MLTTCPVLNVITDPQTQTESTGASEEFWGKAGSLYGEDTPAVRGSEVEDISQA